jgi:hypothetical protein
MRLLSFMPLYKQYINNSEYNKVVKILTTKNNNLRLDHIAFRVFPQSQIKNDLLKLAYDNKYEIMPEIYNFNKYLAKARWYKSNNLPRIFMSEYSGKFFPNFHSYRDYQLVYNSNQYLAWTSLFCGHINHIAIQVDNIEESTNELIKNGIKMNEEGGIYKVSKDELLIQSATMSNTIDHYFSSGELKQVPYSFVELVQRKICPITKKERDGFEEDNAGKIFSSTSKSVK